MQRNSRRSLAINHGESNTFAERAKAARLRAGLSQQQLSDRLQHEANVSLDTSAITRIEAGQRDPRLSEALALAKVLEFELDDLVSRADLDSYMRDVDRLMKESHAALINMIRSVDPVVDFVRRNPVCLGDGRLEDVFSEAIERFHKRMRPEDVVITTKRGDERLKRQLLRAVSDGILVRADELQPAYDRWFNEDLGEDRRARRNTSTTSKTVRGRQRVESRTDADQ